MGQAAIAWQRVLRHLGHTGEVYADEVAPAWRSLVRPASALRPAPEELVLYHHGIASPLASRLMHLPCRRGVVFHNVTPSRFYAGTRLEESLIAGRAQLAALADFVELSIGVSRFNARELEVAGHRAVKVVPLFVEPERFAERCMDPELRARLATSGRPRVVSVSRVVPHKRMEDLLSLHAELRQIAPLAELWVVGGFSPGSAAFKALAKRARGLGGVKFLGRVSHAQLVAAYRSADVFVSMSEHEGFGVPLIEAMACELPVLAFGAAAVPETMGGRGIVFDEKHFAALAELVQLTTTDPALRERLIDGQRARVAELSFEATRDALAACLPARPVAPRPAPRGKPRVALVVQRFGEELTGGAEAHARQVALRLAPHARVEVLTTCATDHLTWANEFPPGDSKDGPLTVTRFPVRRPRQLREFNRLSKRVFAGAQDFVAESHWLAEQGPLVPGLLETLSARRDDFEALIFFTYLYAPTAWGVPLVASKALVVPTAHDEPPLAFGAFDDAFSRPRALLCNTPEEISPDRATLPPGEPPTAGGGGHRADAREAPTVPRPLRDHRPVPAVPGPHGSGEGRARPGVPPPGAGARLPRRAFAGAGGRGQRAAAWHPRHLRGAHRRAAQVGRAGGRAGGGGAQPLREPLAADARGVRGGDAGVGQRRVGRGGRSARAQRRRSALRARRRRELRGGRAARGRGAGRDGEGRQEVRGAVHLGRGDRRVPRRDRTHPEEVMKLMGKDITPAKVMAFVTERLEARGLSGPGELDLRADGVEARVDPLTFNLQALEANADATQGLPLETHRDGLAGRAVVVAKRVFRGVGQVFINEALGRQRVFNGHVRDSYAQLAAEVIRLRKRVEELEGEGKEKAVSKPPAPRPTTRKRK